MFFEEFFELFIALHHPFEDSMCGIFIIIQKSQQSLRESRDKSRERDLNCLILFGNNPSFCFHRVYCFFKGNIVSGFYRHKTLIREFF